MAIINAAANGNWSSAATWPGGVFPTPADDVFANNRTVYIDQDINVLSLNTTQGAGGVAGGRFYVNQGNWAINVTNIIQAGTTYCVTVTGTGTRTLSSQFFRASDTTTPTAAVLILGTTGLPDVVTYGNAVGGTIGSSSATNTPAGITIEGGSLTHYGFISGGNVASRSSGLKIYQAAASTIPVSAIVYGNVKGGPQNICPGIICEYSPAANTLSACLISIYGNLSGGDSLLTTTSNNAGIYLSTTIHTEISGNLHGGSGYSSSAAGLLATGSVAVDINVVGNVYSTAYLLGAGITYASTLGNINLTGDVIALDNLGQSTTVNLVNTRAIDQNGGTTLNILGNVYGGRGTNGYGNMGIFLDATCTVNITGNVHGGNNGFSQGAWINDSPSRINVYGNVYGNNTSQKSFSNSGIYINSSSSAAGARVNIFGSAIGSEIDNTSYGVNNLAAATVYARRAVANSFGVGAAGQCESPNYGLFSSSISGINLVEEMVFGSRGQIPVFGPTYIVSTTTNSVTAQKSDPMLGSVNLGQDILVDSTTVDTLVPTTSNVRADTTYSNNLTGTMIIPSMSSVSFDIPVGNTRGTAFITPSAFWNTQTTQLTSLSSTIGFRLNNVATTEYIGNTLAAYNI